ncbi:hypothetical protein [Bradyrhizobium pachyrhizi]|uniref:hypothetical protein n=1 Tax=Bradyrhizobium pachyrhizi TaxID=280333 RepID=UPI0018DFF7CD|nr:hypothetical protein [Bradyrhizobium pachyrhizi]
MCGCHRTRRERHQKPRRRSQGKSQSARRPSKEIKSTPPETLQRIAEAIASQGSAAYTTPSGPILDLLTKLAEEDDRASFSRAFILLARAAPANAAFVGGAVPAKISNFLIKHRGVKATALIKWTESNPDWTEELKNALRDPDLFVRVVENFASAIKHTKKPAPFQESGAGFLVTWISLYIECALGRLALPC